MLYNLLLVLILQIFKQIDSIIRIHQRYYPCRLLHRQLIKIGLRLIKICKNLRSPLCAKEPVKTFTLLLVHSRKHISNIILMII